MYEKPIALIWKGNCASNIINYDFDDYDDDDDDDNNNGREQVCKSVQIRWSFGCRLSGKPWPETGKKSSEQSNYPTNYGPESGATSSPDSGLRISVEEHVRAHKEKNWVVDIHREESKKLASCCNRCPYAFQRRVGLVIQLFSNRRIFFLKPAHRGWRCTGKWQN